MGRPTRVDDWPLTCLQQHLVKTGGRLVKHARYYSLLLAESVAVAALWSHAVQDGGAIPLCGTSGVGEPPTERIAVTREAVENNVQK